MVEIIGNLLAYLVHLAAHGNIIVASGSTN